MNCRFLPSRLAAALPATLAASACLALALASSAQAQTQSRAYYSSDPSITIDFSALGGPGSGPAYGAPAPGGDPAAYDRNASGLIFPPPAPPPSRLNGQYSTLTPPPSLQRPAPAATARAPQSRLIAPPPAGSAPAMAGSPLAPVATTPPIAARAPAPAPAPTPAPAPAQIATPAPMPAAPMPTAPTQSAARTPTPPAAVPPPPVMPQPTASPASSPPAAPPSTPPSPPAPAPAAAPASPPATSPATSPAPVETAARTSTPAPTIQAPGDAEVRILFDGDSPKLPDTARDSLIGLVGKVEANPSLNLQIEAYAAGTSETASQARRLSLSRALAVRSYLIEQGVRSTRVAVRALGNKPSDPPAPPDRVDIKMIER